MFMFETCKQSNMLAIYASLDSNSSSHNNLDFSLSILVRNNKTFFIYKEIFPSRTTYELYVFHRLKSAVIKYEDVILVIYV
jgi:hypothetical protein